jgi:hypothetical protein
VSSLAHTSTRVTPAPLHSARFHRPASDSRSACITPPPTAAPIPIAPRIPAATARVDGFDLAATTEVRGEDRERLENLCRYLLRPALADRRLRLLPAEQVALELKSPWKDGTTWISMSADTFLERLCSLVPRPRTNQVLYRGVLAAHSARRPHVVPERDDDEPHRPRNATFCELMKHGLNVDVLACPCGHRMTYVATIFDKKDLARLLRAQGLPHRLEPIGPARGPPQQDFAFGA